MSSSDTTLLISSKKVCSARKMSTKILLIILIGLHLWSLGNLTTEKPTVLRQDSLDGNHELTIEFKDSIMSIKLDCEGQLHSKICIGNAFHKEDFIPINLHKKEGSEYLLLIHDRSSTYGARTGIVISQKGSSWQMTILPFNYFSVSDDHGHTEFHRHTKPPSSFHFDNGMLIAVSPSLL